jgi:sulfur relay (sulfurtransferase) DsrC/TusE family protein
MTDNSGPLKYPPRVDSQSELLSLSKNISDPAKNLQRFFGFSFFSVFALVVSPTVLMINALNAYGSEKVKSASIIPTYKSGPAHQTVTDLANNLWGFVLNKSLSEPWNFLDPYWKHSGPPIKLISEVSKKKPDNHMNPQYCQQVEPPPPQQIIQT